MAISLFDLYHVYSNIFPLDIKVSKVYCLSYPRDDFDRDKFVRHGDKIYSSVWCEGCETTDPDIYILQKLVYKELNRKLISSEYIYKGTKSKKFFKLDSEIKQVNSHIFKIYNGFIYRLPIIQNQLCICINHTLSIICYASIKKLIDEGLSPAQHIMESVWFIQIHNTLSIICYASIKKLIDEGLSPAQFNNILIRYKDESGKYYRGYVVNITEESIKIRDRYTGELKTISGEFVYPEVRPEILSSYLRQLKLEDNLTNLMRENSFLSSKTASTDRATSIISTVSTLNSQNIFPITFGNFEVRIDDEPIFVKGP